MSTGIGDLLRRARQERGGDLETASEATHIPVHKLAALEDERFHELGADIYARGFIRAYAEWLGIDADPLLARYRDEVESDELDIAVLAGELRGEAPRRRRPPAWLAWAGVGALVLVAALSVAGSIGGRSPEPVAVGGVGQAAQDEDDAEDAEAVEDDGDADVDADEPAPAPTPTPEALDVALVVEERAWIRVEVDGSPVEERTVPAGETLEFEAEEEVALQLGNAGGVTVVLNDESQGSLAARGSVWTGVCTVDGCVERR